MFGSEQFELGASNAGEVAIECLVMPFGNSIDGAFGYADSAMTIGGADDLSMLVSMRGGGIR